MGNVVVKYNNEAITPTPLVSRSYQFIDYGGRWGQVERIDLTCYITGVNSYLSGLLQLATKFTGQFKSLEVLDDAIQVYKWDRVIVQEVTVPNSPFPLGGFVPYTTKLISYQVPSGVIDPVNEYAFTQGEDGVVTVAHKISARGIKHDTIGALDNAIQFVKQFVNRNPYTGCIPGFIPNGSGILLNVSENINRAECIYSVNEIYKFVTGSTNPYIENTTLSINDSRNQDYTTLDLAIKWQGSPIKNNLPALQTAFSSLNVFQILQNYGLSTGNIYQNTFNITQDSGATSLDMRATFLSGLSNDFSGFFDYVVSFDEDMVTNQATWRIEGEFICKGPLSFRRSRINTFKATNQANSYIPYLGVLLTNSALYQHYSDFPINAIPTQLTVSENTGLATLKLAATFSDADAYGSLIQPKYTVDVEPSKWIYELIPAANIEGHYVLQDLQMKNQAKIKLNTSAGTSGTAVQSLAAAREIMSALSGIYIASGFVLSDTVSSGISEIGLTSELLGKDNIGDSLITSKVHGSIANNYIRPPGFKFGY